MLRDHESEIKEMYRSGMTLQQIGDKFGVSRQAINQCFGLCRSDGGAMVRAQKRQQEFVARRDAKTIEKYGCTWEQYKSLLAMADKNKNLRSPAEAFHQQRQNAKIRGIAWEMKLWDWWRIWDVSGKWSQRGRGQGYVMARKGDTGPYSVDNVYIATSSQNIKDSYIFRPYHLRKHNRPARQKTGEPTPRQKQIIELRSQGLKWSEVGARLGITGNGACAYYGQAMREVRSHGEQAA